MNNVQKNAEMVLRGIPYRAEGGGGWKWGWCGGNSGPLGTKLKYTGQCSELYKVEMYREVFWSRCALQSPIQHGSEASRQSAHSSNCADRYKTEEITTEGERKGRMHRRVSWPAASNHIVGSLGINTQSSTYCPTTRLYLPWSTNT